MNRNSVLILISLLFGIVSLLFVWLMGRNGADIAFVASDEDGIVESLSAIFYLIALIVSFYSIFKTDNAAMSIVWAILCFLFLGEETSWFQRLFNYSVPFVEKVNVQNEFNIHNLNIFHGGGLRNSSIELSVLMKSHSLFRLGFFGYFFIVPLLFHIQKIRGLMLKIGYRKPDNSFIFSLSIVFVLAILITLFCQESVRKPLAETREMLYALFIMIYIIIYIKPNKKIQLTSCVSD